MKLISYSAHDHHIRPGAEFSQNLDDGNVRIGLHRIADEVMERRQAVGEHSKMPL